MTFIWKINSIGRSRKNIFFLTAAADLKQAEVLETTGVPSGTALENNAPTEYSRSLLLQHTRRKDVVRQSKIEQLLWLLLFLGEGLLLAHKTASAYWVKPGSHWRLQSKASRPGLATLVVSIDHFIRTQRKRTYFLKLDMIRLLNLSIHWYDLCLATKCLAKSYEEVMARDSKKQEDIMKS